MKVKVTFDPTDEICANCGSNSTELGVCLNCGGDDVGIPFAVSMKVKEIERTALLKLMKEWEIQRKRITNK